MLTKKNNGVSWKTFTNLPDAKSKNPIGTYALNGISCVSARSCVAVGSLATDDGTGGIATAIATGNGGITWTRTVLRGLSTLLSVSCVPGGWQSVCFASGGAIPTPQGWPAAVAISRNGGLT